jgi:hypothetical protein
MFQAEYLPNEAGELSCGVQFGPEGPSSIWYFEEIAMMVAPGEPTADKLLRLSRDGLARRKFRCDRIRMGIRVGAAVVGASMVDLCAGSGPHRLPPTALTPRGD